MITIAVLSQKGGVGKTITSANLAATLADLGLGVLMIDFDPQADLSASWGLDDDDPRPRIEDSLALPDSDVRDALVEVPLGHDNGGIALLPTAYERLRRQTARLLGGDGRQLANVLAPLDEQFDVVLIDTPAGDTVFGRQAMVAADAAIVPMLPGYHELRALTRALDVIEERAQQERTRLELLGVLVLNADRRWRSTKEYGRHLAAMAAEQQIALFDTVIPRHQPVAEHARYGLPTVWLRPKSSVGIAYRALAVEVVERLAGRHELRAPAATAAPARAGSPSDPRLRGKLRAAGEAHWVENVWGVGYRLAPVGPRERERERGVKRRQPLRRDAAAAAGRPARAAHAAAPPHPARPRRRDAAATERARAGRGADRPAAGRRQPRRSARRSSAAPASSARRPTGSRPRTSRRARMGGCDHPDCVVPMCWTHHRAYDTGRLDLLRHLEPRWRTEIAHAVAHLGLISAYRRLTGGRLPAGDAHEAIQLRRRDA